MTPPSTMFPRQTLPYYIWAPSYTHASAGVRALHLLCHLLNSHEQKAYLIPDNYIAYATNAFLDTPLLPAQHQNFYGSSFIAVYPDVVRGNPLNAKHIVRWLLAPKGAYGGDSEFLSTDMVYGYAPGYVEDTLFIPLTDPDIFYPPEDSGEAVPPERSGSCFYSHKYEMHGNTPDLHPADAVRLVGSPHELSGILRKSKVCYVYELSEVIVEASLCGCPVVLVRTPYFNKAALPCEVGGVRWSDGEVVSDVVDYIGKYFRVFADVDGDIKRFIHKTQRMAEDRSSA